MTYSVFYDLSCMCYGHCLPFVAVLDGSTVGRTWEQLSLLRDAWGLSGKNDVLFLHNACHGKQSSPWVLNLLSRLLVDEMPGGSARCRLGRFVFVNQQNSAVECWIMNSPELECWNPFFQPTPHFGFPSALYPPPASWSRHNMSCTKQSLPFRNPPSNLHNFILLFWATYRYTGIIMLTFRM